MSSGERDRYYICEDYMIANECSGGLSNFVWNYYNLVSGKQYKQKLRPQNSQKKGYMYCLIN